MMLLLALVGVAAGVLGALVGIGGGVIVVPILSLGFGIDVRIAVATSLVSVIATSTAAGSVYVGSGLANMRLGMALEVTTTVGGITGGLVAVLVPVAVLQVAFGLMLVVTSVLMIIGRDAAKKSAPSGGASAVGAHGYEERGALAGAYFDQREGQPVHYRAERLAVGGSIALLAGAVSGMLGVGGGFLKVPAMTLGMRVPIRVAAATSNFMIGVTAVTSLVVYFTRGYVHPTLAAPVALGVVAGSLAGSRLAQTVHPKALRYVLAVVLVGVALEMLLKGAGWIR
ncbi:MAG: sulfite exporter TauE/SafE family protein [Polyangiaceae bacterium]|nr:sulfite exporter TauE/SafE family protein [Polyangiaceae bacterium]